MEKAAKMENQLDPAQWQCVLLHLPHNASPFIEYQIPPITP